MGPTPRVVVRHSAWRVLLSLNSAARGAAPGSSRSGPTRGASQHRDQPIDRDHQNVPLKPLDTACANQADHRHRPAPTPPPTPARQPCRLVAHTREMTIVVRPGLGLDREPDTGRRDRQRVDVPSSLPRQRVPECPPVRLKRRERAPDLVLGASAHAAAPGEQPPVASVEPEPRATTRMAPAADTAPAPATANASSTLPPLAIAATAALDSRWYCCRRA